MEENNPSHASRCPFHSGELLSENFRRHFHPSWEIGITQECGCVGFNGPDGRQGCVLMRTVESNQGLRGCKELKLIERIGAIECSISKNELIKHYKDVFTGVGEFPNEPYHITLKDNAVPVIHPPRCVPLALQPKSKSTLDRLEKEGTVSKVNKPTDWVCKVVEKPNGNLRLCLDPRDLNKVIKREHYQIPCTDDIISRLEGKKIFSVVDLKDGFWHVPLDVVSSEICKLNTPFGRYKFNKILFGIVSAPEVFQKRNQKLFRDIERVEIYFDDISLLQDVMRIHSHDTIMSRVLERAKFLNIQFNPDKLQYRVSEVKYVGQIISKSGIKSDPIHIKAIAEMPTPKSKTEVKRLLGMMNFLLKFITNVSTVTDPLREIIRENVEFNWGKEQELSFVNIKELLAKAPI
ncbi:hypothetical protein TNCV_4417361 [Trichonephila clavipes]|nr:hypothetical protein TNCV_4417361 [Trichonephila clavipes]